MSNARNLADLLGTNTTIQTAKLADDAIQTAKLADDAITSAKLPAGSLLQVQTGTLTTEFAPTGSWSDTGLSVTITPTSSSNDIYILMNTMFYCGASSGFGVRLLRDSTSIYDPNSRNATGPLAAYGGGTVYSSLSLHYLDSPATTSAITYKIQAERYDSDQSYFTRSLTSQTSQAYIMAWEIAG